LRDGVPRRRAIQSSRDERPCRERTGSIRIDQAPHALPQPAASLQYRKRLSFPVRKQRHRALQHQRLEMRRLLVIAERLLARIRLVEQEFVRIVVGALRDELQPPNPKFA
jgi:hypothetical protein